MPGTLPQQLQHQEQIPEVVQECLDHEKCTWKIVEEGVTVTVLLIGVPL